MLSDYQQTIKATTSLRGLSAVSIVATNELRDLIKSCDVGFKLYTDHSTSARDELKKLHKQSVSRCNYYHSKSEKLQKNEKIPQYLVLLDQARAEKLQKIQDSFQMVKQEFRDAKQTAESLQDSIEQRLGEFEMGYKKWT